MKTQHGSSAGKSGSFRSPSSGQKKLGAHPSPPGKADKVPVKSFNIMGTPTPKPHPHPEQKAEHEPRLSMVVSPVKLAPAQKTPPRVSLQGAAADLPDPDIPSIDFLLLVSHRRFSQHLDRLHRT
ncbi:MAG: hypothetical protein P4L67_02260 [Candidatus Pacebacteria bacterium]|nr:hypothetical protein [Candidatus Paceibacterota bacterium]